MSWEVVPDAERENVLAATQEGRCVSCYGTVDQACPEEHECYCCECDDTDCCPDCRARVAALWMTAADEELPDDELPVEWEQRCTRHASKSET